ncbi:fatty acid-binding protein DegV [Spiroplasma gladiatoris]|uniref:Fatty acid-binding protein DegV n=1 Tax=Spiroplasma gladiatoris TaxID=2143 RepID=A0A4P7AH69_9MOLU|nr:DegV family protein [Spiroplasma gladiatoris]QBQ07517.1 fatty acid-binding protein DegV [Spiroplasma gladiatoris]
MKTAIIIDSACGVKDLSKYKDTFLVPLLILREDGTSLKDDENFTEEQFNNLNGKELLRTSQSITGEMLNKWDELLKDYDQVICLLISKGLSGQFNTFKMFANNEENGYKGKVHIIDNNGVSILIKRQLEEVRYLLDKGLEPIEVCQKIENKYENIKGYIIPKSLEQLVRGGRVTKAAASLAKILKITPILSYTGIIDKEDKTRTFKKAIENSLDKIIKNETDDYVIDIAYSDCSIELLEEIKKIVIQKNLKIGLVEKLPFVIICHTGAETFAFFATKVNKF